MKSLTPLQREVLLEALEHHRRRTSKLRSMAYQRNYSTKDKHEETLDAIRALVRMVDS